MNTGKNILICPLEWGLGHAGRMIPLARKLQALDYNIIIGSGKDHLAFFRREVPGLTYINFPGFRMRYSRYLPQYLIILFKLPLLIFHTIHEHIRLKRIIKDYSVDIVISDSRPGLWNKKIKTVFVLHIPRVPFPEKLRMLESLSLPVSRFIIKKYSFCFIPDLEGEINISGRLSHGFSLPANVRYIGLLSRFSETLSADKSGKEDYKCAVILSGPEPQKKILKQRLTEILAARKVKSAILEGKPGTATERSTAANISFVTHPTEDEMCHAILGAGKILSRSGYTTIMELISLNRTALIIPTPGQTEQEYLAGYLSGMGWFKTISQKRLTSTIDLEPTSAAFPPCLIKESKGLLDKALRELLE